MRRPWLALIAVLAISPGAASADSWQTLRAALAIACPGPAPSLQAMAEAIGAAKSEEEPVAMRGRVLGWKRRFGFADGGGIEVQRFAPGGLLRRVNVVFEEARDGKSRPALVLMADHNCRVVQGRRLVYDGDGKADGIEIFAPDLARIVAREKLNPPVPPAPQSASGRGVLVATVDSGVNYTLPAISARLARDSAGAIVGYDFWDMDARPFDANPAPSPFFVQRHGTRTASVLLREAPMARLAPYRYPRPEMSRMADIVAHAARSGIVIVAMPLGSNRQSDWREFAVAAKAHPAMLFVVSAGNNGRDIDAKPVYPAALKLANMITVTSSTADGRLARGSNWGAKSVDLMVPAEGVAVIDFRGRPAKSSGSSFAVPRVAALAARLLASHPDWRAPELKAAILARAKPTDETRGRLAAGLIADPERD